MTDRSKARSLLIEEVRDAVGDEALRESDLDVDRSIDSRPRSVRAAFGSSRLLLLVIGGALLVAGVIAALATGSWIWFGAAIAAHALISVAVIATALAQTKEVRSRRPRPSRPSRPRASRIPNAP
jgi:hypothetical protein